MSKFRLHSNTPVSAIMITIEAHLNLNSSINKRNCKHWAAKIHSCKLYQFSIKKGTIL